LLTIAQAVGVGLISVQQVATRVLISTISHSLFLLRGIFMITLGLDPHPGSHGPVVALDWAGCLLAGHHVPTVGWSGQPHVFQGQSLPAGRLKAPVITSLRRSSPSCFCKKKRFHSKNWSHQSMFKNDAPVSCFVGQLQLPGHGAATRGCKRRATNVFGTPVQSVRLAELTEYLPCVADSSKSPEHL